MAHHVNLLETARLSVPQEDNSVFVAFYGHDADKGEPEVIAQTEVLDLVKDSDSLFGR